MTPSWKTRAATPVTVGEGATVLAEVPEDAEAYLNSGGRVEPRTDADEPAGGAPVLAAATQGDGVVVALGSSEVLRRPSSGGFGDLWGDLPDPLVGALLSGLGNWDAQTSTGSGGTAESTETGTADGNETEAATPGFGVLSAVGALAAVLSYLRKRSE